MLAHHLKRAPHDAIDKLVEAVVVLVDIVKILLV
jgi:hypothetical protein